MSAISGGLSGWFRRGKKKEDVDAKEAGDTTSGESGGAAVPLTGGGETEPVVVWEAPNRMEAEVVRGRLESEGIPAIITGDVAANIFGFHTGDLAKASVLVPAPLADRALEILETAEEAPESDDADSDTANSDDASSDDAGRPDSQAPGRDSGAE